ncbi:MAG: 16S rRNA (adenine(1518)-N(6)/adenine(1519)-N(6))-dimethyltransferase RsmA [Bacillota bacterium]|nr:16S rRNA (adenine(1518)-N(6)/adenine(1519)-N(6))-dimethyltransferase RsmA [Bacillota bacterium]
MSRLPGTSPAELKALLAELGVRPNRRLGQNFLVDGRVLRFTLEAAAAGPDAAVLEVGPGTGTLTAALLEAGSRVLAVERDRRLAAWLAGALAGEQGLRLLVGDVLRLDWRAVWRAEMGGAARALVVSNLPYAISGPFVRDLLGGDEPVWERMVLLVQREFADRLTALPGEEAYGALTLLVRRYARAERLRAVSPASFWPEPEVESALIRLWPLGERPPREPFESLVRAAFAHRRKTLENALQQWEGPGGRPDRATVRRLCQRAGVEPSLRAEELDVADFERLAREAASGGI